MALVTRANYKTRAGIGVTTHDGVIDLLIPEAEEKVESFCDRTLEDPGSDATEYFDGTGTNTLLLNHPITSITSVSYLSGVTAGAATYTAYGATEYYFDSTTGHLHRYSGIDYAFPESNPTDLCWPMGDKNIRVVYQRGYDSDTVPGALASAIYDLIGLLFHARNGTRDTPTETEVTAFLNDRIPHYRRQRL